MSSFRVLEECLESRKICFIIFSFQKSPLLDISCLFLRLMFHLFPSDRSPKYQRMRRWNGRWAPWARPPTTRVVQTTSPMPRALQEEWVTRVMCNATPPGTFGSNMLCLQPSRSSKKIHNFGKRSNSIRRNPSAPVIKRNWLYKQVSQITWNKWKVEQFGSLF